MPLKTSCFSKGIYFNTIKRFWLIGIAFAFFLFLTVISYLNNMAVRLADNRLGDAEEMAKEFLWSSGMTMTFFLGFFCLVAGLACFSYIQFQRSTGMMHALPVSRECLFTTHYLAGLTLVYAPILLNFAVLFLGEAFIGITHLEHALVWLAVSLVTALLLYSFTVFAGMFTGHMAAQTIFYLIFNLLAIFLETVIRNVFANFLYGYGYAGSTLINPLSPIVYIEDLYASFARGVGSTGVLIGYLIAGLLFTAAALLIYRRRRMEVAGDVISLKVMKPIFKYTVAFCASALIGSIFIHILNFRGSYVTYVISYLTGGFIGYFASEMLLRKTFRVFKSIKGYLVFALVLVLLLTGLQFDFFGYETYVPKASEVQMMYVGGYYNDMARIALNPDQYNPREHQYIFNDSQLMRNPPRTLNEDMLKDLRDSVGILEQPATLDKAIALHTYITTHRDEIDEARYAQRHEVGAEMQFTSLSFIYLMKDGRTVLRSYYLPYFKDNRSQLDLLLKDLYSSDEMLNKLHPILSCKPEEVLSITITKPGREVQPIRMDLGPDKDGFLLAYQQDVRELDPLNALIYLRQADHTPIDVQFTFSTPLYSVFTHNGSMIPMRGKEEGTSLMTDNVHALNFLIQEGYITQEDIITLKLQFTEAKP